jgi:hypothetical protein
MTNQPVTERADRNPREAVNAVFDALSAWRDEVSASTARYSQTVLDKMATAATAMGWPKELVEASRNYCEQASKIQTNMIDQLMDAWQEQLKSPMPSQFIAQLPSFPGLGAPSHASNFPMAPVEFWMEAANVWQRNWASVLSTWSGQAAGGTRGRATPLH